MYNVTSQESLKSTTVVCTASPETGTSVIMYDFEAFANGFPTTAAELAAAEF